MRTFEFKDGKSNKFWNIEISGISFTVTYGKIGTTGQTQTKDFPTEEKAKAAHDKLVAEKLGKGYVETTAGAPTAGMPSSGKALENAIFANPDDLGAHAAYADWLIEQGDPRGEFIQVQLALEDEKKPVKDRKELQKREKELLKKYEREWLGDLARHLIRKGAPSVEYGWQRGFLSNVSAQYLTIGMAQALADAPIARILNSLRVWGEFRYYGDEEAEEYDNDDELASPAQPRVKTPSGVPEHWELFELIGGGCLRNLRLFQMGDVDGEPPESGWADCHTYAPGLEHVIAAMPCIEELHLFCKDYDLEGLFRLRNLSHLRVLRVYHLGVRDGTRQERKRYEYPLDVLARNQALTNLTHLLFHPHHEEYHFESYQETERTGRHPSFLPLKQVQALISTSNLPSLTHLQLRLSDMGDDGVRAIIDSGILRRLKWLDLRHGCITDEGARLFAACPESRNLENLDLSRNAVTKTGLALLRRSGIPARADRPLTERELADQQYIFEGDSE